MRKGTDGKRWVPKDKVFKKYKCPQVKVHKILKGNVKVISQNVTI